MTDLRLYGVTDEGPQLLPVPENASDFSDLYDSCALGTYSALRTFQHNKFLHLGWHIARTRKSMKLLEIGYAWDEQRFRQALHEVVSAYPESEARVRFDILAAPSGASMSGVQELIAVKPFEPVPPSYYVEGICVDYAENLRRSLAEAKDAAFAAERSQLAPGRSQAHYEYLILDPDGHILEGTMSNFWVAKEGVVWTAAEGMLEGVTRRILLSLLPRLGIPLRLQAIHRSEIVRVDEAAISGSSRAIIPVVSVDGEQVGDGRPGPVFGRVLGAYDAYVAQTVRTAVAEIG